MADIRVGRNQISDLRTGNSGSSGGVAGPIRTQGPLTLEQQAAQRPDGPRYFGFHTDASIGARLAQQGVNPNPVNLRIARDMLRYGIPIDPATLSHFRQLWQGLGSGSLVELEALLALFASGIETGPDQIKQMASLYAAGPISQRMAQLTMALQAAENSPVTQELRQLLGQYWRLGAAPGSLPAELPRFQAILGRLETVLSGSSLERLPAPLREEAEKLLELRRAQDMLLPAETRKLYVPFHQWQDQSPMPGELLIQGPAPSGGPAGYAQVTLAVETRTMGRVVLDFTAIRDHLALKIEVQDEAIKQRLERGLPDLRHRLVQRSAYSVASILCQDTGGARSVSLLLPRRRDPRRLGRAIGVI
jgi:hypothetical protein